MDAVVTGQDKPFAGALLWPSAAGLKALDTDGRPGHALARLRAVVADRLATFNAQAGGSSRRIARFLLLAEPPSIDAGEITDKGYVNQRATQDSRAGEVASLFTAEAGPGVMQL
jgi:feruloyl-CoA synthase